MTALFLRLVFLFSVIECSESAAFRKIVGTDEYALVGVANCFIGLQTNIGESCPNQYLKNSRGHSQCTENFALLYLPSEKESTDAPKILTFFPASGKLIGFNLQSIPNRVDGKNWTIKILERTSFSYLPYREKFFFDDIIGILYNHLSGFLYVLHRSFDQFKPNVTIYLMVPDENSRLRPVFLSTLEIHEDFLNTQWSSDPYSENFYYHKQVGNLQESKLFSIPYDSLLKLLKTGTPGHVEKEKFHTPRRDFFHVTNGLMFSHGINSFGNHTHYIASLHRNVHGQVCYALNLPRAYQFFVLTGWEYCKIRDERFANYSSCMQSLEQKSIDPLNSSFLWAITAAVIVNAIILLVILCVVCKRKESDLLDNGYYVHSQSKTHPTVITPDEMYERRRLRSSVTDF